MHKLQHQCQIINMVQMHAIILRQKNIAVIHADSRVNVRLGNSLTVGVSKNYLKTIVEFVGD